jgi:putative phage-type endonuclease
VKIINLIQGSQEWHAHRAKHFNASDAPAMMDCSPYKSRAQLLRETATGIKPEIDPATQKIFDDGHRFEALARPLAEQIVGEELYPVTGTEGKLSASFDGLTMDESVAFEHKTLNAELREIMANGCQGSDLPKNYRVQMEQQCLVSGCDVVLFMASKWKGDELDEMFHCRYFPDKELAKEIKAGWKQFETDLENYQHTESKAEPTGKSPESLPALRIEVTGMVTASNIDAFKSHALAVFEGINKDLQTDEDFSDAEKTVKWCKDVEDKLEAAKQHALSQTADIDALFRAIDDISAEARRVRIDLDKLVKTRKENIRIEIMREAETAFAAHVSTINARLGKVQLPAVKTDFAGVMKGKKTVQSLRDACDTELARAKIEASLLSESIGANVNSLRELAKGFEFLFMDAQTICQKQNDDLVLLIKSRIADHKAAEQARIDAEVAKQLEAEKAKEILVQQKAAADYATHKVDQNPMPDVHPAEKCYLNVDKDKKPTRPSDEQIILTISAAYEVDYSTAESWIMEMQSRMVAA